MRLTKRAQPALDQGRIGQNPAVHGAVVDLEAALEQQFLDVAVAQRIAQVPGDGLHDQRRLVVAALEVVLGPALQLGGDGVQDHRPLRNRRRPKSGPDLTSRERRKFATSPIAGRRHCFRLERLCAAFGGDQPEPESTPPAAVPPLALPIQRAVAAYYGHSQN